MRSPASEKLGIIRLLEGSHLRAKRRLDRLGIPTFYRWYDRSLALGEAGLEVRKPHPGRVWTRSPDEIREGIECRALDETELSPRERVLRFTDTERHFASEALVYPILKAHDLIASRAFVVIKAIDEIRDKTKRPNQMWQTDFASLKITGRGWSSLGTILDDVSRAFVAWKLCTTLKARDVTDTPELALAASGCDSGRSGTSRGCHPTTAPATSPAI
ncbi:hypothetical protein CX676_05890 [Paracoccus zhejiangensis]|uniref:Integrase catalytic domain-containing protein n=1 Tax=Paracoccus zhejiangensis TaxID=1077935 RepID=A0A2H5EWR2_9RHOB|nr:hypothetical protein CX676_05890 [Paracoccus zhejiangensis]